MKILFAGYVFPEPRSSAAGIRSMELMRLFESWSWEVHFSTAAKRTAFSELPAAGAATQVPLNDAAFDALVRRVAPDVCVFDRFVTEEQFSWRVDEARPSCLRVLDTSDLHFLRLGRRARLLPLVSSLERLSVRPGVAAADLRAEPAQRELASLLRCDLSLVISSAELRVLDEVAPWAAQKTRYLPFACDADDGPGAEPPPEFGERRHVAMLGSFLHEPNVDAARTCRHVLWPRLRRVLPVGTECHVFGAYCGEDVRRELHAPELGFFVDGRCDDSVATLRRFRLQLCPLRFGAGLKGKVVDGARAGAVAVGSEAAFEGFDGLTPRDAVEDFVHWAGRCYAEEALWAREASAQRRALLGDLAGEFRARAHALRGELEDALRDPGKFREGDLLGGILWREERRSTKFFGKWLELKSILTNNK